MRKLYYKNKLIISLIKPFENKRLFTSLKLVILTLKHQNLWPQKLIALDAFCQTGLQWTRIFSNEASYLEMWDIDSSAIKYAKEEYPNATVSCGNSIDAFKNKSFNRLDFNFILIDTPLPFHYLDSFEHFSFFENIFNNISNEAVVILNVAPSLQLIKQAHDMSIDFMDTWSKARCEFYNTKDGMYVSPNIMIEAYTQKIKSLELTLKYISYNARNESVGLVTIVVKKQN